MGLFERKMKDPVSGTGRVVDNDGLNSIPGQSLHCPLDLIVEAEGIPAYSVHITVRPKTGKWPEIRQTLPVIVDRSDPSRVEIVWDQIPSLQERIEQGRAHRLDVARQSLTGESVPSVPSAGSPQDLMRQAIADPAAFIEMMRSQRGASLPPPPDPGTPGAPIAPTPTDPIDQLAKLADLRDRGVVTEHEFQAQKRRILGE